MNDNQTTANKAAVGAALGGIVLWLLGGYLPEALLTTDGAIPEQAAFGIPVVVTWLFCRLVPAAATPMNPTGTIGAVVLALIVGGCATKTPLEQVEATGVVYEALATPAMNYARRVRDERGWRNNNAAFAVACTESTGADRELDAACNIARAVGKSSPLIVQARALALNGAESDNIEMLLILVMQNADFIAAQLGE